MKRQRTVDIPCATPARVEKARACYRTPELPELPVMVDMVAVW
ncbi:hypothetical protein ACIRPH_28355 [Nocardiopsis sp. NPDC101807]